MTCTIIKNLIGKPEGNSLGDLELLSNISSMCSEIEVFSLQYLHDNINTHTNVVKAVCNLIGRIVKVSWLKDLRQRELFDKLNLLFDDQFFMQKMKLEILLETVIQINQFLPGMPSFFS